MDDVHQLFGLSYANMLVMPRSLMQSMPQDWQERFGVLWAEWEDQWAGLPEGFLPRAYRVQPTENGQLVSWNAYRVPHYNRGRTRVEQDGTVRGGR